MNGEQIAVNMVHDAVLWDMDGTLIDSAEYHWHTWRDTLAGEGHALTDEQFASWFGQRNDAILRRYFGDGITPGRSRGSERRRRPPIGRWCASAASSRCPVCDSGWRACGTAGWRQAVASSAPPANIEVIIEVLGLDGVFDAWVSAEEVAHGKPAPDVFLRAAEKLGVPPARSVVVEDAPAGVEAGQARRHADDWPSLPCRARSMPTSSSRRSRICRTMPSSGWWGTRGDGPPFTSRLQANVGLMSGLRADRDDRNPAVQRARPIGASLRSPGSGRRRVLRAHRAGRVHQRRSRLQGYAGISARLAAEPFDGGLPRTGGGSGISPAPFANTRSGSWSSLR